MLESFAEVFNMGNTTGVGLFVSSYLQAKMIKYLSEVISFKYTLRFIAAFKEPIFTKSIFGEFVHQQKNMKFEFDFEIELYWKNKSPVIKTQAC